MKANLLLWLCSLMLLSSVTTSHAQQRIGFSIFSADEPTVVQASPRSRPAFSIHDREQTIERSKTSIAFSVLDAQPLPQPKGSLTGDVQPIPPLPPEEACTPARMLNRILVVITEKSVTESVREKVCDAYGCRFVTRNVQHSPAASTKLVSTLTRLPEPWKCGTNNCDHFKIVSIDDPKQAELIHELDIKRADLPLLVKETEPIKRRKASGLSLVEITRTWNTWFIEPLQDPKDVIKAFTPQCLPTVGDFTNGPRWDYLGAGSLRGHLIDIRGLHHLPKAVVDQWSDQQVQMWHNWHHEVLSKTNSVPSNGVSRGAMKNHQSYTSPDGQGFIFSSDPNRERLSQRVDSIARSIVRTPPTQLVLAANNANVEVSKKKFGSLSIGNLRSDSEYDERLSIVFFLNNPLLADSIHSQS